jgi:uncharacterized integral membrane protein
MKPTTRKLNIRLLLTGASVLLSASIVCLSLQNWQIISLNIFTLHQNIPTGLLALVSLTIGLLTAWLVASVLDRKQVSAQKQVDWQAQDAKLVAEMVADKERLLRAKIDTLEAALKTALKKHN